MFSRIKLVYILLLPFLVFLSQALYSAEGRILDTVEAEQAGKDAFVAEEKLFASIGNSIALSLAYCKIQPDCEPSVDKDELNTLIDKLDDRINSLILKQESSEEDYTELLTAYVNHRENYLDYQEKLDEIATVEQPVPAETTEEDAFADEGTGEEAGAAAATSGQQEENIDFSVFEDVDEALPGTGPDALQEESTPEE